MAKMSPEDLAYFKDLLLNKRKKVEKNLVYLRSTIIDENTRDAAGDVSNYSFHMADQGTDAQEREKSFMFVARDEKYLKQLNAALIRIENGSYGICRKTGKMISKERLEAVPTTTISVDAKKEEQQ